MRSNYSDRNQPAARTDFAGDEPCVYRADRVQQRGVVSQTALATGAVLSLFAASIIGTYAAGAFIGLAFLMILLQPVVAARDLFRFSPLLLLPLLALVSTAWSDAPERTSRAALELLVTVVAAIIVANRLSARALILTIYCGILTLCLIALTYVPGSLSSGAPLSGPFETKNPMGFTAQLLMAVSLVVMVDKHQPSIARLAAIPSIPMAAMLIYLSQSGNAIAGTALMLLALPSLLLVGRSNVYVRVGVLLLTLAVIGVGLVFLPDVLAAIGDFRQNVLKKDATLTGRTHLWEIASQVSAERPWLGHGYYAFWRHGNIDAEALWRWGGISARSGFNFHNAFVEMQVDLGLVGAGLFIATCAGIAVLGIYALLMRPTPSMAFLLAFIMVLYVRSYTESGLIAPFSLVTLLWIATAVYAVTDRSGVSTSAAAGQLPPLSGRIRRLEPRAAAF